MYECVEVCNEVCAEMYGFVFVPGGVIMCECRVTMWFMRNVCGGTVTGCMCERILVCTYVCA